jgi:signal transduction histidine kinase
MHKRCAPGMMGLMGSALDHQASRADPGTSELTVVFSTAEPAALARVTSPEGRAPKAVAPSRRPLAVLLVVLGAASAGSVSAGAYLLLHNYRRFGLGHWTAGSYSYYGTLGLSLTLGVMAGLWLWWRAPTLATGRWLWLASISLSLWVIGVYWPNAWGGNLLQLFIYPYRPALAMVLLGWPTGRPSRRVRRWILAWFIAQVVLQNVCNLFDGGPPSPGTHWPGDPLTPWDVSWVGNIIQPLAGWAFYLLPPAALVVILLRRLRGQPPGARRISLPMTITGVAVAGSDVLTQFISLMPTRLLWDSSTEQATILQTVNLVQNYAQLGMAAVGTFIAFQLRQRGARASAQRLHLDLGQAAPVALPSVTLQGLLGDTTARVLYPGPSGDWIDADGEAVDVDNPARMVTKVFGPDGSVMAAIDTARQRAVHSSLVEVAAATVLSSLQNDKAQAEANSRLTELHALQLELVNGTDDSRKSLESDLHDGAQQGLVGLSLAARLSARSGDSEAVRQQLASQVRLARQDVLALLESGVPVPLRAGLAGALRTLAATSAVRTELELAGDLGPDDPLAKALWMVASEAVANAEKHSGASHLRIELVVGPEVVTLRVRDDGRGGRSSPPRSIMKRVEQFQGEVAVVSPPGAGTEVLVTCGRESQPVPA